MFAKRIICTIHKAENSGKEDQNEVFHDTSFNYTFRAVCRKHELMQYDLEMAAQDLTSKKQQCEELATGVSLFFHFLLQGLDIKSQATYSDI